MARIQRTGPPTAASASPVSTTSASAGSGQGASACASEAVEASAIEARADCLMNARYHSAREAFLDTVHRWFMFAVIAFGAVAVVDLAPKKRMARRFAPLAAD